MYEKVGNDYELFYRYDNDGKLSMIVRYNFSNSTNYYYNIVTNTQGDVVEILSGSGSVLVEYTYDAWGNIVSIKNGSGTEITSSSNIGLQNSIRYRGYVYDTETGLYYLQSRYYDPVVGRFINCDDVDYIGANDTPTGWNGFSYCENDPVNFCDPCGYCYLNSNGNISHDRWEYSRKYSAKRAIEYANTWCEKRNKNYYKYGRNGDCTNFVSQCLYEGGLMMDNKWHSFCASRRPSKDRADYDNWDLDFKRIPFRYYRVSDAWSLAKELYNYLSKYYSVKKYKSKSALKKAIKNKKIRNGDVAFFNDSENGIHHSVLIGKVTSNNCFYYAHSKDRNAEKESIKKNGVGLVEAFDHESIIYVVSMRG